MQLIRQAADFLKQVQRGMRRAEVTREPLTFLRFEWRGDTVECDWLMRAIEPADQARSTQYALERQTEQAFRDALRIREQVFESFSAVTQARLRMFRGERRQQLELVLGGTVNRLGWNQSQAGNWAVKAKAMGLEFEVLNGVLCVPQAERRTAGL